MVRVFGTKIQSGVHTLHGMHHCQIGVVDIPTSGWTERQHRGTNYDSTGTRSIEAGVLNSRQDPRSRLCKDTPETIHSHRTIGSKMLTGRAYREHQNQVAGIVCRNICVKYGLEVPKFKLVLPLGLLRMTKARSCGTSRYRGTKW